MKKVFPTWLVVVFFLAVLLRFSALDRNSLWFDEAWGVFRANQPVETTLTGDIEVGRPPLYYVGLHYWIDWFGSSELSVRLPSAIASLLSVGLIYSLGHQLFNRRVALVAMSLLAVSTLHVWYAQEVRMYIFISFLGLIAANGLAREHWLAIIPVTATLSIGLYVDFPMIPLWISLSGIFFVYWWVIGRSSVQLLVWLISTSLAIILYQPWWAHTLALFDVLNNIHFFKATRQALNLSSFSAGQYIAMMIASGFGISLLSGLVYRFLQQEQARRVLAPLIVIPFLLLTVGFVWPRLYGLKRVLLTGWPYVCLLVAWLIVTWQGKRQTILYSSIGISLAATLVMLWAVPKDDWRSAVAHVDVHAQPEDVVWIAPNWNDVAYAYYESGIPAHNGSLEELSQLAITNTWLVAERFPGQPIPSSASEAWLDENLQLVEVIPFYRLEVRYYRPNNSIP